MKKKKAITLIVGILAIAVIGTVAAKTLTNGKENVTKPTPTQTEQPTRQAATPTSPLDTVQLGEFIATAKDSALFYDLRALAAKQQWDTLSINKMLGKVGNFFMGTPYEFYTLEGNKEEKLVINLRQMDCATYMEQCLALARTLKGKNKDFGTFALNLQKIRYRGGVMKGYTSRLHYLEDWMHDNCVKGYVTDVTKDAGGVIKRKRINYMSTHPQTYKHLTTQVQIDTMAQVEADMNKRTRYFIPRDKMDDKVMAKIEDGDIIGFTTNVEGLDCGHVGFAQKGADGVVHFMHCSMSNKKVLLTGRSLTQYMSNKKHFTGIEVVRARY